MDIESITKIATVSVAGIGALVGLFQFVTSRRSQSYQNYKTELELLGESIVGAEHDPGFKEFLVNVRKEKLSFVAFGMPIPNADLERVIRYYKSGNATTHDIAKAWRYRNPTKEALSFELHGAFKAQLIVIRIYAIFCLVLMMLMFVVAGWYDFSLKEFGILGIMFAVLLVIVMMLARANEGLFTAARLAKLEKKNANETRSRKG